MTQWTSEEALSDLDPMDALQQLRHDYDLCRPVTEYFMAQVMRQLKQVLDRKWEDAK